MSQMPHKPYRCFAIELIPGMMKARFECPRGHRFIKAVFTARRHGLTERSAAMMVRWWRKEAGGVTMDCPQCEKDRRGAENPNGSKLRREDEHH